MPDLATHVLLNAIPGKWIQSKKNLMMFILGAVLPDVLTRVPANILSVKNSGYFVLPLHSPLPLLLVCYIIVLFFHEPSRKHVFCWLYCGIMIHLFADGFQIHMGPGYYWLYPFSWFTYHWGLYWPETSLYVLPFLFLIFLGQLFLTFIKPNFRK